MGTTWGLELYMVTDTLLSMVLIPGLSLTEGRTLSDGWEEFKDKFWAFYKVETFELFDLQCVRVCVCVLVECDWLTFSRPP